MKTKNLVIILLLFIALAGGLALVLSDTKDNTGDKVAEESTVDDASKENEDEMDPEIIEDAPEADEDAENEKNNEEEDESNENEEENPALFIEEGLVAYYPFNEDIKDYSGKEIDATNHNAFFVDGKKGKALKFNGKNSYVHALLNINPIPMPRMTMTAWVKAEDGEGVRQIISSDNSGYDRAMGIDHRGGGQGWSCFAGDGKVLGYRPIAVDEWTFVAAVYDQTLSIVKLCVDESVIRKKAKIVGGGNDFLLIGANGSTKLQREFFMGVIDEVKIYDYALSDTELSSLRTTGIAKPKTNN